MSATYVVADVRDALAAIPDGTVDLILTSPPFLALRSYLPPDHPDKHREIGSEPTPAAFVDTLLGLSAEWRRVLAPHGTLAVELGDTYSGSGGAGGDYAPDGLREGQGKYDGSNSRRGRVVDHDSGRRTPADGWPLAKSLSLVPEAYRLALAYGHNPLTGDPSPAGRWRVRNVVDWCLDIDTAVYVRTPTGDRPMRLLHLHQQFAPGKFQLWDGDRWTPVLGTSTSTANDALEVEFRNGEVVSCTREHQWPIDRDGLRKIARADELTVGDVVPTVRLPGGTREPAGLPDDDIGWLVGVFLADGSFDSRDRIQIAGHRVNDLERARRLARIAADYDGTCSVYEHGEGLGGNVVVRCRMLAETVRRYIGGGNARNKHLAPAAWNRSDRFLRALLDGYLVSDGWWDERNRRWRLGFTDNPWLARDLRTIGARLGVTIRVRRRRRPVSDHHIQGLPFMFRGEVRFDEPRPGRWGQESPRAPLGEIVAIRASRRSSFVDVGVEGEPHLFALASGLLTHNCRPNPPVGALGDKFRPSTSDLVIACTSDRRWFDLDAVRTAHTVDDSGPLRSRSAGTADLKTGSDSGYEWDAGERSTLNPVGAPPLDHWIIPPGGYRGSHYAVFPPELCRIPIEAMCPRRVCRTCGTPSRRVTDRPDTPDDGRTRDPIRLADTGGERHGDRVAQATTTGWSSCGCPGTDGVRLDGWHRGTGWRPGLVLDPFGGSGTTGLVATGLSRDAILIDLDARNLDLARERLGMLLVEGTLEGLGETAAA